MNLAEIKARTMRNVNFVYNDGDHIKNLINEALVMLAADARIQTSEEITLIAGQSSYPLPANYKESISLVTDDFCSYSLTDVDSYNMGYYIYGSELVLRPEPQESKVVTLNYYQYPDELFDDEDVPGIDLRYHDVLATYAAAMVLSLPGIPNVNNSLIERYFSLWEQRKSQFKVEMQRKHKLNAVRKVSNYD